MFFYINESYTSELCTHQAEYNRQQMNKLDSEIQSLRETLKTIPYDDYPAAPEDVELANALINKIEHLSDCADTYERQVDYWETQKCYALSREKMN